MELPIPHDWDGESWLCVRVQWPDSPMYIGLLMGFLVQMSRGRFWDGRTGSIIDAQAVGLAVELRNTPLVLCSEQPIDYPPEDVIYIYCGGDSEDGDECEDGMGSCTIPYGAIKVIDGVLQYKTCDGWVAVEGWDDYIGSQIVPDDGDVEPGDPPLVDIACRKADWMGEQFVNVLEVAYTEYEGDIFSWGTAMRNAFPNYSISNWSITKMYAAISAVWSVGVVFGDVWSSIDTQRLICLWYPHLTNVDFSFTRTEYDAMKSAKGQIGNVVMQPVVNTFFDALNFSAFQYMAVEAKSNDDYDCDCPTGPTEASQVFFTGGYNEGTSSADLEVFEVLDGGRRVRVQYAANSDSKKLFAFDCNLAGALAGDNVTVRLYHNFPSWSPGAIAETQSDPAPIAEWHNCSFQGQSGAGVTRVNEADYVEFTSVNVSGTLTTCRIDQAFITPTVVGGTTQRNESVLEIVAVNGERLTPLGP